MMDKLHAMHVFTKVVDTNSFSRAAEALGMPAASVTTAVQNLEALLKVRLLNRTTRRLSLTPDGAAFYERSSRILAEVADAENSFSSIPTAPRGKLRIDMLGSIGRVIIVPKLADFQARYPDVDLMLGFGDKPVDLVQEGVDCVIRVGNLQDSSLVARRIGTLRLVTAASPAYLDQRGTPKTVADLQDHVAVAYFSGRTSRVVNMTLIVDDIPVEIKMPYKLSVNDADAYLNCGLKGLGLIQIPHFLAGPHLESGDLVEILPLWSPAPLPISAVYPQNKHLSAQVRVFIDWAAEIFEKCSMFAGRDASGIGTSRAAAAAQQAVSEEIAI